MNERSVVLWLLGITAALLVLMHWASVGWNLPRWEAPCPKQAQTQTSESYQP